MQHFYRKVSVLSFILLFSVLACNTLTPTATVVPSPVPPTLVPSTPTLVPLLSQQVTVTSLPFDEDNPGSSSTFAKYKLTAQTPQLTGSDDPRVAAFNQRLQDLVTKEVDAFRKNFQELPVTEYSSGSSLEVSYTLVSQVYDFWSFKFDFSFYSDGAAHPGLYSITINYDLNQGKELALSDLFIPNSNYLDLISKYCVAELSKQPFADSMFLEGADPKPENYRTWIFTSKELIIYFDEYQVAPYAAGPQTVNIPLSELQSVINPQGPLSNFTQ